MKRKIATTATVLGFGLAIAGVALVYVPAAFILAGAGLLAFGLVGVEL